MLVDRFETLDTGVWHPIGHSTAAAVVEDGEPMLAMLGDGVWVDGIHSDPLVDLTGGATVELEFRLPLSRRDRQSLRFCLSTTDPQEDPASAIRWDAYGSPGVCALYPAMELSRFDSTSVVLYPPGVSIGPLSFPDDLPARDWTHLAIQVRPDGAATLVLNRRARFTLPFPLRIEPDRRWRILLTGRAVDTDLRVRNLVVWRGERYDRRVPRGLPPRSIFRVSGMRPIIARMSNPMSYDERMAVRRAYWTSDEDVEAIAARHGMSADDVERLAHWQSFPIDGVPGWGAPGKPRTAGRPDRAGTSPRGAGGDGLRRRKRSSSTPTGRNGTGKGSSSRGSRGGAATRPGSRRRADPPLDASDVIELRETFVPEPGILDSIAEAFELPRARVIRILKGEESAEAGGPIYPDLDPRTLSV